MQDGYFHVIAEPVSTCVQEIFDRAPRQARGPGIGAVPDEHIGREHDSIGNRQQLLDLRLGGRQQRRQRGPQALRAQPQQ